MLSILILLQNHLFRPPAVLVQIDPILGPVLLEQSPEFLLHPALHLIGQDHDVLDVQVAVLGGVVNAIAILVELGHALAGNGVDLPGLDDLAPLPAQVDNVPVQVRQVPRPVAHPGLADRQDLLPVQIVALSPKEDPVDPVRVVLLEARLLLDDGDVQVPGDPVGALVGLVLVHDARAVGHAPAHLERDGRGLPHHPLAPADLAPVLDGLAPAPAGVALHLDLRDHAGSDLVPHHPGAVAVAAVARVDHAVGRPGALALVADLLLLPLELGRPAVVKVAQRDADLDLDVGAAALARLAKVPAPAKESGKEVEGVMVPSAALLALLEALVPVLVVDLAGLGVG